MLPTVQIQTPPDVIDLGRGDPSLANLPLESIHESAKARLTGSDNSFLQYGTEQGDGYFRRALADFLTRGYGFDVPPETLFITNGISSALELTCTLFTQAGDTIFVEEPSYFLALKIFADHRLNVVALETDEDGLVPASLEEKLAGLRPRFLYLIPSFHNPSGHTLPQARRDRIVELAKQHNFLIVADEVYHFLNYGSPNAERPEGSRRSGLSQGKTFGTVGNSNYAPQTFKPFAFYTDSENIISLSSFSKILAPGLRLGWIQAHPNIIARFASCGLLDSGGGMNPFTSALVRGVVESGGLEKNIGRLRLIYQEQVAVMDEALRLHVPESVYQNPRGGYFFWVRFPSHVDTRELRQKASTFKVDFRPGALFSSRGELKNYMRLCFVHYEKEEIVEGITRLKECLLDTR
jgi:DNA-binding transcriptional MocR family regulator